MAYANFSCNELCCYNRCRIYYCLFLYVSLCNMLLIISVMWWADCEIVTILVVICSYRTDDWENQCSILVTSEWWAWLSGRLGTKLGGWACTIGYCGCGCGWYVVCTWAGWDWIIGYGCWVFCTNRGVWGRYCCWCTCRCGWFCWVGCTTKLLLNVILAECLATGLTSLDDSGF